MVKDHPKNPRELVGRCYRWEDLERKHEAIYEYIVDEDAKGLEGEHDVSVQLRLGDTNEVRVATQARYRNARRSWQNGECVNWRKPPRNISDDVCLYFVMPGLTLYLVGFGVMMLLNGWNNLSGLPILFQLIAALGVGSLLLGLPAVFLYLNYKMIRVKKGFGFLAISMNRNEIYANRETGLEIRQSWANLIDIKLLTISQQLVFRDGSKINLPQCSKINKALEFVCEDNLGGNLDHRPDEMASLTKRIFVYFFIGAIVIVIAWVYCQNVAAIPIRPLQAVLIFVFIAFGLPSLIYLQAHLDRAALWFAKRMRLMRNRFRRVFGRRL